MNKFFVGLFSIVASIVSLAPQSYAQVDTKLLEERMRSAVDRTMPAVVSLVEAKSGRAGAFSGVVVSADGYILSAAHAVSIGMNYRVQFPDGRTARATALGINRKIDCAMIKIQEGENWPHVEMGQSSKLAVDQPVFAIGYPGPVYAGRGFVVRMGRVLQPISSRFGMILSTALMEPGDSGGGLFDLDGKLVGIRSQIQRSVDENFDIPVDSYRQFWEQLKESKEFEVDQIPGLPEIGFQARRSRRSGARVQAVDTEGVAAKAGLLEGDLITEVEGGQRGWIADRVVARYLEGDRSIELTVVRDEETKKLTLEFSEPDSPTNQGEATETASSSIKDRFATNALDRSASLFKGSEDAKDDLVVSVRSDKFGRERMIRGTRIGNQGKVLSKSSMVGDEIEVRDGESWRTAKVLARKEEHDLVLLQVDGLKGEGLTKKDIEHDTIQPRGLFVVSPMQDGPGLLSMVGSPPFSIPKEEGRGYLGVSFEPNGDQPIINEVLEPGAAQQAGMQAGDVILQINDKEIKVREEIFSTLRATVPEDVITLRFKREDEELEKKIKLGEVPKMPRHVAEDFQGGKSLRRDGFPVVFCHDAALLPEQCGGPLFDTQGRFVGINIARSSRTMSFALPTRVIRDFLNEQSAL